MTTVDLHDFPDKVARWCGPAVQDLAERFRLKLRTGAASGPSTPPPPDNNEQLSALGERLAALHKLQSLLAGQVAGVGERLQEMLDAELGRRAGEVKRIPPLAYLRTVWALLWTAFRHPFTTTYIDPFTGKVLKP